MLFRTNAVMEAAVRPTFFHKMVILNEAISDGCGGMISKHLNLSP
jgi:hypothetical protein